MKILVMSDSHGREEYVYLILAEHADADAVIFLGDGERDIDFGFSQLEAYRKKTRIAVRGNCDMFSDLPVSVIENIKGYRFYITHGYAERVKSGVDLLCMTARKNEAQIALFGHTHSPCFFERDGLFVFNPGSVQSGSYGIITMESGQKPAFRHCLISTDTPKPHRDAR